MRVVDLFCGCGGLSLGFQNAGFNVVSAYDNWCLALEIYRLNFNHRAEFLDLKDVEHSIETIIADRPNMIIGGPPCQDFSSAGNRNEDNGRGDLTTAYAEIVSHVHPEMFVMENVERITKTNKLSEAIAIFKAADYGLSQIVLDASKCGVPQKRKRFIMIGRLGEQDGFIDNYLSASLSEASMTIADYLGNSLGIEYYYRHPRSYARRGIFSIYEPSPTIRGVNRPMPPNYELRHNDPIRSKDGIRALTTIERSYIQTFPQTFRFLGGKTDMEQLIGNAVPVNLGHYVASAIKKYRADNGLA